ncbi:1,2-dihydroxy-3-keto-5-methylthiopentene dioxygenase [Pseudomonas sp. BJa5]|uniref:1,2-dihydroxy-3-keto-5-methylthiopentene dioxygenase n=1 Tax=Pseudomonas sp. BJa5 TaxID=2936270 RepID=UPI0025599485|nr:acireductone dioxygenase [Pseudomonas sp. BGr12]MDL2420457.1 acireductone dioxygenase [Pseudomonas sp. BGr12]
MSLTVYHCSTPDIPNKVLTHAEDIAATLAEQGVRFERWQAAPIASDASDEALIAAYQGDIDRLMTAGGYRSVDVERVSSQEPQAVELRECTLEEDLVRLFVAGRGMFTLRVGDYVYAVACEKNDLIVLPAGTRHWVDMGENPHFVVIRLFNRDAQGGAAVYSGEPIAESFARLDD